MHIVAISGSLRKASCNTGLLRAIGRNLPSGSTFDLIVPGDLPLFNQDIEGPDVIPASVVAYRQRVKAADAFVFATCENNFSVSAPMKNAIDWASRGPDGNLFNDKAAAVVGAGGGVGSMRAQNHLRDISLFLNLHIMTGPGMTLNIFQPKSPFDMATGDLVDPVQEENCGKVVSALIAWHNRLNGGAK